jgi:GT2 family glycosyltransferase
MQLRFPPHVEWIFVSDDPVLHQVLTRILERRSNALKGSAALVTNRFNYGFGASNNIGASVARGKTLLFMNSDIWVDSAQPLEEAERKLQADTHQLIGFRLLYEDGSIQHDGMAFRPSPLVHNLLLAEHPRKGTPADDDVGRIVTVPAVTGAMMMISKDVFMRVGQFDRAYIKGDFEDADLCMKVRAHGGQIGLYKTNDIYHLERQSIRLMADETGRLALTYLNCITFNERWGKILAQRPAPSGQAKTSSAAASAERGETQRKRVRAV